MALENVSMLCIVLCNNVHLAAAGLSTEVDKLISFF